LEEIENKRGRKAGVKKEVGYISINEKLRVKVEEDNLTLEELVGNDLWGKPKYFISWEGLFEWLIKRMTTDKISQKELWSWQEAQHEIIKTIKEVKYILLHEIDSQLNLGKEEVRKLISKY
jgi:hypothetical protein